MRGEDGNRNKDSQPPSTNRPYKEQVEDMKLWGVFLFGLIGATITTLAVGRLRRTVDWFYTQLSRSQSSRKGATGSSFRSSYKEEGWKKYSRRKQEEYEEEMERVERLRRMQSVFNRERNKYKKSYESWTGNGEGAYQFQRDDWYWKTQTSPRHQRTNYRETPNNIPDYSLSHHYLALGLDRSKTRSYTDAEIKTAFQAKAKQFHPDQNQDNKEAAEAKFKEVMMSYEAIKQARKNSHL